MRVECVWSWKARHDSETLGPYVTSHMLLGSHDGLQPYRDVVTGLEVWRGLGPFHF